MAVQCWALIHCDSFCNTLSHNQAFVHKDDRKHGIFLTQITPGKSPVEKCLIWSVEIVYWCCQLRRVNPANRANIHPNVNSNITTHPQSNGFDRFCVFECLRLYPKYCMLHEQRVAAHAITSIYTFHIKRESFERDTPGVEKGWY